MVKIIILGSASAIPDEKHLNTHIAVVDSNRVVLIDCPGLPTLRLNQAGIPLEKLTDIILTHFHPDHVSGLPSLLMTLWLLGRKKAINIYGLDYTLDRAIQMLDLYEWKDWEGLFPVNFHRLPEVEMVQVLETENLIVRSSPLCHIVPSIGLRLDNRKSQHALAYSSDTEPCEPFVRLAYGADIVLHEATGHYQGHTSAKQAGIIANRIGCKNLYLVHYHLNNQNPTDLIEQAKQEFDGQVSLAEDLMTLYLGN